MNGAKSRVEKLCQAFENGKDLVELSDHSPHDISNVLKLYLRQVSLKKLTFFILKWVKMLPKLRTQLVILLLLFFYLYLF